MESLSTQDTFCLWSQDGKAWPGHWALSCFCLQRTSREQPFGCEKANDPGWPPSVTWEAQLTQESGPSSVLHSPSHRAKVMEHSEQVTPSPPRDTHQGARQGTPRPTPYLCGSGADPTSASELSVSVSLTVTLSFPLASLSSSKAASEN